MFEILIKSYEIIDKSHIFNIMNLEDNFMTITATEFKMNFGKYMELVKTEDILITKNGKVTGLFTNPDADPVEKLSGMLKGIEIDEDEMKKQRIKERYGIQL